MLIAGAAVRRVRALPLVSRILWLAGGICRAASVADRAAGADVGELAYLYLRLVLPDLLGYVFPHVAFYPEFSLAATLGGYDWTGPLLGLLYVRLSPGVSALAGVNAFVLDPRFVEAVNLVQTALGSPLNYYYNYYRYLELYGHCWFAVAGALPAFVLDAAFCAVEGRAPGSPLPGLVKRATTAAVAYAGYLVLGAERAELSFVAFELGQRVLRMLGRRTLTDAAVAGVERLLGRRSE